MIRAKRLAYGRCERLDLVSGRLLAAAKHLGLQLRAEEFELVYQRTGYRLDHPMDVNGSAARVGPEIDVDLFRLSELVEDARYLLEERTEFERLVSRQLPYVDDVSPWLYDQRPNAERADAVLDEPVIRLMEDPTRQVLPSFGEITRETAFHREEPTG